MASHSHSHSKTKSKSKASFGAAPVVATATDTTTARPNGRPPPPAAASTTTATSASAGLIQRKKNKPSAPTSATPSTSNNDKSHPTATTTTSATTTITTTPIPSSSPSLSSPSPLLSSLFVFSFVLFIYTLTVYPSITGGDSGELVICACNYGIAHPPGYPTFTLLAGSFLRLLSPLGYSAAHAVNTFSSLCGAAAAALLHATTLALTDSIPAAVGAGAAFALTPTVWLYSIQGEVFALNNMCCSAIMWATVKFYREAGKAREEQKRQEKRLQEHKQSGKQGNSSSNSSSSSSSTSTLPTATAIAISHSSGMLRTAYLGSFLCGVAMTNQHTTIFTVIPTVLFVTFTLFSHSLFSLSSLSLLTLLLLLGFSPYLYLPLRSLHQVVDSWGDQRSFAGFRTHFLREEYGTFQLAASEISEDPGMWSRLKVYGRVTCEESLYVVPVLAVVGVGVMVLGKGWKRAQQQKQQQPSRTPSTSTSDTDFSSCSVSSFRVGSSVLLLSYVFYMIVFHKLANLDMRPLFLGVQARFWQQPNAYLFVAAGVGLHAIVTALVDALARKRHSESSNSSNKSRISLSSSSILYALVFLYLSVSLAVHFPRYNHRSNPSFHTAGLRMLSSFPPNAIVLLNGDLNNNIVKYPQQCEGVRPDLSLLSLQLMTWDWFVPMQRHNYPNVTMPGNRYHILYPDSFNIKQFLDANIRKKKRKVYLCGPWKEGDFSLYKNQQGTEKWYDEIPFGECSYIVPSELNANSKQQKQLSSILLKGAKGLVRMSDLPPWNEHQYDAATWEHVLYTDAWQRLAFLASFSAYHSNHNPHLPSLLLLAHSLYNEIFYSALPPSQHFDQLLRRGYVSYADYRTAGVIYGNYAKLVYEKKTVAARELVKGERGGGRKGGEGIEEEMMEEGEGVGGGKGMVAERGEWMEVSQEASRRMYHLWLEYVKHTPGETEISQILAGRVNPYTGQRIENVEPFSPAAEQEKKDKRKEKGSKKKGDNN